MATEKKVESMAAAKAAGKAVKAPEQAPAAAPKAPVTAVKAPAKKAAPKKAAAKKPAAPKAEKAPKAVQTKVYVEYQGRQVLEEDLVAAVKADWSGEAIKSLELYVKPEDGAVYYVVNGKGTGAVSF